MRVKLPGLNMRSTFTQISSIFASKYIKPQFYLPFGKPVKLICHITGRTQNGDE
jgi:hypothetical protein